MGDRLDEDEPAFVLELSFGGQPDRLAARPAHREHLQALHQKAGW
ncbi:hypothetical protein [Micromonospora sp. 050-3]